MATQELRRKLAPARKQKSKHIEQLEFVCDYSYTDPTGRLLFKKKRFKILNPLPGGRTKTFRYFNPNALPVDKWRKPESEGAGSAIYNLPAVLRAILSEETIHWTEGEKDADALIALGYVATTVHQGANKVTRAQAAWLRGASAVIIWVDKDQAHPEVGAHDAAMRHDLLVEVGCAGALTFVRAAGPWGTSKDAYDHIAAGHSVEDAVVVPPAKLAAIAAKWTPSKNWSLGYAR